MLADEPYIEGRDPRGALRDALKALGGPLALDLGAGADL